MKNGKSIQDYESALDKQLEKLQTIDEEDQSSYKIADFILRKADSIRSYAETKIKFEKLRKTK